MDIPVAMMDPEVLLPSYLFFLERCVFILLISPPSQTLVPSSSLPLSYFL